MKRFVSSLARIWYVYVIVTVAGILLIDYAFNVINKPRNEETITLFVVSEGNDLKELKEKLEDNKPNYLREINIYGVRRESNEFSTYFDVYGKANSDVVILPESKIEEDVVFNHYSPFSFDYLNDYIDGLSTYRLEKNGLDYGVKIHSKGEDNGLIEYKSEGFDEDYYAFFVNGSLHIGEMSDSEYTTAFSFINIIRGEKNGQEE
ncbi:MAG: hypothetical protein IJ247_06065 [Bacilli bacterium]|nr:hypothetical protein [Bacilli bacterium]